MWCKKTRRFLKHFIEAESQSQYDKICKYEKYISRLTKGHKKLLEANASLTSKLKEAESQLTEIKDTSILKDLNSSFD